MFVFFLNAVELSCCHDTLFHAARKRGLLIVKYNTDITVSPSFSLFNIYRLHSVKSFLTQQLL